jgi:hypothetical protein
MRKALKIGVVSAGILMVGSPALATEAHAAENFTSVGNVGVLSGNQVSAPIQIPVNACGIALGILGSANAGCEGGSSAVNNAGGSDHNFYSAGNIGIGNGNQVHLPVQAPVNVCGISIAILGTANSACQGGSDAVLNPPPGGGGSYGGPVHTLPVRAAKPAKVKIVKKKEVQELTGVLSGLLGTGSLDRQLMPPPAGGSCDVNMFSAGNIGILGGNQVYAPIQAPIDISGVAAGVGGPALAWSQGGSKADLC